MKARRPSSVSRQSLSLQLGPRCRCFILFCSAPHVNSLRQTGLSARTRATRRLDSGPSTPLRFSNPRVSLVNGHVRRLHLQPGFNFKTDKAHCAPCSALSQDRQGAPRLLLGLSLKTDKAHRASCSASLSRPTRRTAPPVRPLFLSLSDVHCTYRSATQPTSASPTWQRSEDAGAVADATAAKSKLTGLLLHHQPRPRAAPQRGPRRLTSSTTPSTGKHTSTSSPTTSVTPCAVLC